MKNNYLKSPMNYSGGKFKLLPQILPLFPENINNFYDLFCGGCNVGINVQANKVVCNDMESSIIDLYNDLLLNTDTALETLKETINKYELSKTNKEGFKNIRNDYNNGNKTWDMFYSIITHSFNNQIRFNKKGEYNMPFGKNKSSFNPSLEKHFVKFLDRLSKKDIEFSNKSYSQYKVEEFNSDDMIYCDPPYLISCATYNEQDGWNEDKERELLAYLDSLNDKGVKFGLSNVLEHKGKTNDILIEWSKKYNIHHLNKDYSNCNYHIKEDSKKEITDEVYICNY